MNIKKKNIISSALFLSRLNTSNRYSVNVKTIKTHAHGHKSTVSLLNTWRYFSKNKLWSFTVFIQKRTRLL